MPPDPNECSILCVVKLSLFVAISVFVLCLPLGDPKTYCNDPDVYHDRGALCCLCDVYEAMFQVVTMALNAFDFLSRVLLEVLYEVKLQFYGMLAKMDKHDLCRIGCYSETVDEETDASSQYSTVRPCKRRSKCCRRKD